ncbi:MAG: glycogen synthase, partial [Candidatus Sumerlaeota bacterium]
KGDAFRGILNGVDYSRWNSETDVKIPERYSAQDLKGKAICKRELQRAMNLEIRDDLPLVAAIGRFVDQKGFHVMAGAIEKMLHQMHMQFAILGSGDWDLSAYYGSLPGRFPGRAGSYIGYNEQLAHLIEAGADFFVMPSFFEPCGLNQLYSLKYGTLPVVRATGGLDDTVEQYDEKTGEGTGFKYLAHTPQAIFDTVGWAISTWYDRPGHIRTMIRRAMEKDFSWEKVVLEYEDFYGLAMQKKDEYDMACRA